MAEIEVHAEEARAAAAKVAAAASAIDEAAKAFQSAAEGVLFAARFPSTRTALEGVVVPLLDRPGPAVERLRAVSRAGAAAVDGRVALDLEGAHAMTAIPAVGVPL